MNERILEDLRDHSITRLNSYNIKLSAVSEINFEKILINSVKRMVYEDRISDRDIKVAEIAFSVFIEKMYLYRIKRSGEKDLLENQELDKIKYNLCPLWPIC